MRKFAAILITVAVISISPELAAQGSDTAQPQRLETIVDEVRRLLSLAKDEVTKLTDSDQEKADSGGGEEDLLWRTIQRISASTQREGALRDYLEAYPAGRFATLARLQIDRTSGQEAPVVAGVLEAPTGVDYADAAFFGWAQAAEDTGPMQAYLDAFPAGFYAAEARETIELANFDPAMPRILEREVVAGVGPMPVDIAPAPGLARLQARIIALPDGATVTVEDRLLKVGDRLAIESLGQAAIAVQDASSLSDATLVYALLDGEREAGRVDVKITGVEHPCDVAARGQSDTRSVVESCLTASEAFPTVLRFYSQLSNSIRTEADPDAAADAAVRMAERGSAVGQFLLGELFSEGYGVAQDDQRAVELLMLSAEQGYARAEHKLAASYETGRGVERDVREASRLYSLAADQGLTDSKVALGRLYFSGEAVGRDYDAAAYWWTDAAGDGSAEAQFRLGQLYGDGRGVSQNPEQSRHWLEQAAEQGLDEAQVVLAQLYLGDRGIGRDYVAAARWFEQAARQGNDDAQVQLAQMYKNGRGVSQDYHKAIRLYRQSAEQGNPWAQNELGRMYYDGLGVRRDYVAAARWWQDSAALGNEFAQHDLGLLYRDGQGVPRDLQQAARLFETAAEKGLRWAQDHLGLAYESGEGVPQDHVVALGWYKRAADQGYAPAQFHLGRMYRDGRGVETDAAVAAELFRAAALQGHDWGQYSLGILYRDAKGVEADGAEAARWLQLAADQDHAWAMFGLGTLFEAGRDVDRDLITALDWYLSAYWSGDENVREAANAKLESLPQATLVQAAQEKLAAGGYDPGAADGLMGLKTRNAIQSFLAENDLVQRPDVTPELLLILGRTAEPARL